MAVQNSIVKKEVKQTFSTYLADNAIKNKINEMVGGKDGQRFITSIISAVSTNPTLAECEHGSIISAALLGESLKLSPSPQLGQYYLVPFNKTVGKDSNGENIQIKVAQFQLGYKGYIQLATRSGYYKRINVLALKEGELVKYDPLTEELEVNMIEDEETREKTETIGYYAMFEYQNGFMKSLYWSKNKMEIHANKYSNAFNLESYRKLKEGKIPQKDMWKYSSYWYKDFDGMAYKTLLRQLISKWGIMSIELQNALEKDMGVIKEDGQVEYVDNTTDIGFTQIQDTEVINPENTQNEVKTIEQVPQETMNLDNNNDPFNN